ncbi:MAG: iron-containing alcohol dehydrogenase [Alphaproteobacteria bacterium]|nr:MAG: iron-containing alcohol dehydrogenase [Alphaproteobacteria bacterium]
MTSQSYYPTKLVIEAGGYRRFPELMAGAVKRLFVVTGHSAMARAGVLDRLADVSAANDIALHIHRGVNTNPTNVEVDEIADACRAFGADCIMGLGGGSSIDIAKMVALLVDNGGGSWDYINAPGQKARKIERRVTKLVAVPTTSGAGSEATPYAVITHAVTRMKKGMGSPHLYPDLAILDPELLALMPPEQIAVTGFDAFGQAIEGFTSGKSTLHSEFYGLSALKYIIANLERCFDAPDDLEAKGRMAWGASLAGRSIGLVDVNLAHAMSHPLSGRYDIQHGRAVALCTRPAIWFNRAHVGDKYMQVAALMGHTVKSPDTAAAAVIGTYTAWAEKFGIDLRLASYEVPESDLDMLTDDAMEIGAIRTNVIAVTPADVRGLFDLVWRGEHA